MLLQRLVPSLAALVLLGMGVHGLTQPVPDQRALLTSESRQDLARRLAQGEALGYPRLLQQLDRPGVLSLVLHDRAGRQLAQWPPAPTRSDFGLLAGPLRYLQSTLQRTLGQREVETLAGADGSVGQLVSYRLPSVAGVHPGDLLFCTLGLWALALLWRRPDSALRSVSAGPVEGRGESTFGRLTLRLGEAFDQMETGVVLLDAQQQIRYLNGAAEQLSGWARDRALNRPVYTVLRFAGQGDERGNPFSLDESPPLSQDQRVSLQSRSGERRELEMSVIRLPGRDGRWAGMLVLFRPLAGSAAEIRALEREAGLTAAMLDALGEGVALCDRYGRILRVNRRLNRMFAYHDDELVGLSVAKLLPVPFLNEPSVQLRDYLGTRQEGRPRVVGWRKNATTFPVALQVHELEDADYHYLLLLQDSGERVKRDKMSARLGRLLDHAAEEIYIFDAHSLYFTEANRQAQDNLGYSTEQLARMTPLHLAPDLDREQFERELSALRNGERRQLTYRTEHLRANGTRYPASLRISYSPEEEPPVFMALVQDITDQAAAVQRLETLAHTDDEGDQAKAG